MDLCVINPSVYLKSNLLENTETATGALSTDAQGRLTDKIQKLSGGQAHQIFIQHLLCHLAFLTQDFLFIFTKNTNSQSFHTVQNTPRTISAPLVSEGSGPLHQRLLNRCPLVDDLPLHIQSLQKKTKGSHEIYQHHQQK